jgi:phosphonate transport system substrate-binding protein
MVLAVILAACAPAAPAAETQPFVIGAIPDQDPELLQRRFSLLADYLSDELGIPVEYIPVTDYAASVTAFRVGDLDMVWFGGLTGVQARLQVDDARAILQRDGDDQFHSVFIANLDSGLEPFDDINDLSKLEGHSFTFGSESSTSGRLMPQYYLGQAGVELADFKGEPGFSGSHDTTIELVEAGAYEAGVLKMSTWSVSSSSGAPLLSTIITGLSNRMSSSATVRISLPTSLEPSPGWISATPLTKKSWTCSAPRHSSSPRMATTWRLNPLARRLA